MSTDASAVAWPPPPPAAETTPAPATPTEADIRRAAPISDAAATPPDTTAGDRMAAVGWTPDEQALVDTVAANVPVLAADVKTLIAPSSQTGLGLRKEQAHNLQPIIGILFVLYYAVSMFVMKVWHVDLGATNPAFGYIGAILTGSSKGSDALSWGLSLLGAAKAKQTPPPA